MKILTIDVGGNHVKILVGDAEEPRRFVSGPTLTPDEMVKGVKELAGDWKYEAVSVGYPGPVLKNKLLAEPNNLAAGWMGFDFAKAFGCPVQVMNDAAMQALGGYKSGKLLFLGLGTGLGSAMIVNGIVEPMELGHLPYKKGTYEDYTGQRAIDRGGKKKWRKWVTEIVGLLIAALEPDDVVIGGGNVKYLKQLPPGCRPGENADAFAGGFRMWKDAVPVKPAVKKAAVRKAIAKKAAAKRAVKAVKAAAEK